MRQGRSALLIMAHSFVHRRVSSNGGHPGHQSSDVWRMDFGTATDEKKIVVTPREFINRDIDRAGQARVVDTADAYV